MFAIAWEYLCGQAVATDPTDREQVEWPPHPDRVFQALVAAWGETGQTAEGRAALEWLEQQGAPCLSAEAPVYPRSSPAVFVPVNDLAASAKAKTYTDTMLGLLPAQRPRQPRFMPSVPVSKPVVLIWSRAEVQPSTAATLQALCRSVTHVGHSSSLVRMWIEAIPPPATWVPVEGARETALRIPGPGRLAVLVDAYAEGGPGWRRPPSGLWQGYAHPQYVADPIPATVFDPVPIILRRVEGLKCSVASSIPLAEALRATVMRHAQGDALRILSGHQADGRPAETPHAAYVALPFVDHLHADGHVMGMALVLPRLEPAQFQACLAAIASALDPDTLTIRLVLGRGGEMMLAPEEREMPDQALRTDTWTRASRVWASATPIVLDRFPRNPADAEPVVALACTRIGLPSPANVQVSGTSWLAGSPHAREFESMTRKQDGAGRWHVHARLTFATPVAGPVILGAGRFRGYGLCRPVSEDIQ